MCHGRGKGKCLLAEGRRRRCAAGLRYGRGAARDAAFSKDSGGWRELLSGAGVRSVSVSAGGIFTGSAAELRVKANALGGTVDDYELSFESGERLRGRFLVTRLDYAGDYNGERTYAISLESAGPVGAA